MKQKILFMTVGTGFGEERRKSLAQGLCYSIKENLPNHIVFFVTEESEKTVDIINELYYEEENEELDSYELVRISAPDDFNECYDKIAEKIIEYQNDKLVLDYTSGTKTMSISMAIIGVINKKTLIATIGQRGETGTVVHSTEEIKHQNVYKVYDELNLRQLKYYFNLNRFDSAKDLLDNIVSLLTPEDKQMFKEFIEIYDQWDKFNHSPLKIKSENTVFNNIKEQIQKNQQAINIILKEKHKQKEYFILSDIINNAKRRYSEGKYDDAVARLYRSLEYIAQVKLEKEYGQISSNIDINKLKNYKLKPEYMDNLETRKQNGKIKLGLREDYRLLKELKDELGEYYYSKENIYQDILNERNDSILAHGTTPTSKEKYEKFEELVLEMAERLTPDIEIFLEKTKFPKFKV